MERSKLQPNPNQNKTFIMHNKRNSSKLKDFNAALVNLVGWLAFSCRSLTFTPLELEDLRLRGFCSTLIKYSMNTLYQFLLFFQRGNRIDHPLVMIRIGR